MPELGSKMPNLGLSVKVRFTLPIKFGIIRFYVIEGHIMNETENLPQGTVVRVYVDKEKPPMDGEIVGLGSRRIDPVLGQLHIIRCTDGSLPNEIYPYDTFVAPLGIIEVVD